MEESVLKEFQRTLGIEAKRVERTKYGEGNHNFFVTDSLGKKYVFKAFKNSGWPEEYKNQWTSKVLSEHNIRFPKVLCEERQSKLFEHGFLIVEFIEGKLALNALEDTTITFNQYYSKVIEQLERVTKIHLPKFGYTRQGEGSHENYREFLLSETKEKIEEILKSGINFNLADKVLEQIENTTLFDKDIPTLAHHDVGLDNVLIDSNNEVFLIDWDSAMSEVWSLDLSYLTFPARSIHEMPNHRKNVKRIHELIKSHYLLPVDFETYLKRERIHHIYYLIGFIHHEYFNMENEQEAGAYIEYLQELLEK